MQNSSAVKNVCRQIIRHRNQIRTIRQPPCDVFINHRGIDTKKNVAGLLYDELARLKLRPFLDSKNMKPGDKLFEKIGSAIRGSKLGIAVFSPRYCDSYFCLHELSLIMESRKKVIPIFCNVKPSELRVKCPELCSPEDIRKFTWALEEAKYTVGLTFDSSKGNFSDLMRSASDAVMENLIELEGERLSRSQKHPNFFKISAASMTINKADAVPTLMT